MRPRSQVQRQSRLPPTARALRQNNHHHHRHHHNNNNTIINARYLPGERVRKQRSEIRWGWVAGTRTVRDWRLHVEPPTSIHPSPPSVRARVCVSKVSCLCSVLCERAPSRNPHTRTPETFGPNVCRGILDINKFDSSQPNPPPLYQPSAFRQHLCQSSSSSSASSRTMTQTNINKVARVAHIWPVPGGLGR